MPLYEYKCDQCDEEFEEIRPRGDSAEATCPKCEGPAPKAVSRVATWRTSASFNFSGYGGGGGG